MAQKLFSALDIRHTTTSSYHPQCNSQAEVCNKTIAKYLAAFVDESTLDWEVYVPALMFAYNTSFHRSVQATPFSLTYGIEARLPAFFAPDFRRLHDPDSANDNLLGTLQNARDLAVQNNLMATDKQKEYFDRKASHHTFHEGQYVLLNEFNFLNKNRKLAPKFSGPFKILRVKGPHNVELLLTNGRKIIVNVARVKQYLSPETAKSDNTEKEEIISDAQPMNEGEIISHANNSDFDPPALTLSHTRRPGRPAKKVLPPSNVSFSKTRREKDKGEGVQKEMSDDRSKNETKSVYANTHPMLTRAAVKRCYTDAQDAQVAVTQIVKSEMDNSENVTALDIQAKLNSIIERTYHCVVDQKKKKKLSHNTRKNYSQASWEGLDTYKYSDYPESGISPQQHVPPAGLPAAGPPAAAAGPPAAAAAHPAGGVPHLVPAAAGQVPAAAPLQPVPVAAAAAAFPANVADYHPPAEWQDLYPLPPDDTDDSFSDEFVDANEPEPSDADPADTGEDEVWLEGEGTQNNDASRLEASSDTGYPPTPRSAASTSRPADSPPFAGFSTPPSRSRFQPRLAPHPEEAEESEESSEEGELGRDDPRGARGGLTESHPVDPVHSGVAEQVAYYQALLSTADEYTQEADRALQALQDSPPDAQLRGRERIRQRSRILRDELAWAESNLRPEALQLVQQQRRELLRPPTRGEVITGFQPSRSLQRTPPGRQGAPIPYRATPPRSSTPATAGRGFGPQPRPTGLEGFRPRQSLARTPPSDRTLRSFAGRSLQDGAPPGGQS
jgi:hypothetical protein